MAWNITLIEQEICNEHSLTHSISTNPWLGQVRKNFVLKSEIHYHKLTDKKHILMRYQLRRFTKLIIK